MIEHERSYVFTPESFAKTGIEFEIGGRLIDDYYLDRETRVRKTVEVNQNGNAYDAEAGYELCHKEGSKAQGFRIEKESLISTEAFDILKDKAALHVKKMRHSVKSQDGYKVTVDQIQSPMNLTILEVEAETEAAYPVPESISEQLFGQTLQCCPLSAFELFRRKIGICGGPSSGKTETAKGVSHELNTQFGANAWHVTEFATTFIQKYGRSPDFSDQFFIWFRQRERERNAGKADIVISDCPTFLAYVYTLHLNDKPIGAKSSMILSKIYKRVLFDLQQYTDIIFLRQGEYKDNRIRYQTADEAKKIGDRIKNFLKDHQVPFIESDYPQTDNLTKDLFYIN